MHSPIATTVHWHGVILPNAMDGVAGVTQASCAARRTFHLRLRAAAAGTRWYHDHANDMGLLRGLFGMFVIEDPRDEPADVEFAVDLS